MKQTELLMGQILRAGLWLSVIIVLIGGVIYLNQHGSQLVHYQFFDLKTTQLTTMSGILNTALTFSARGIIQFGLLILVLTQVLRVALTVCFFLQERDYIFTIISFMILLILIYSIFWRTA